MIEVEGLKKSFDSLKVLDGISFKVKSGELVTVLGPSGCGKTTLIRILAGLLPFDDGNIFVNGEIGVMFQEPRLLPWRTVEKNISLGLELQDKPINSSKIDEMLKFLDLYDFKNFYPSELSAGMKQRVALARTLIIEPTVLLMDEPLSALDPVTRRKLQDKILEIHKEKKLTILFVTHSVEEAIYLGNRIIIFSQKPTKIKAIIKNHGKSVRKKIESIMKLQL
jgi:ABC-type nitrate/sulfonate/bicarbonate transport system ATPase subunit